MRNNTLRTARPRIVLSYLNRDNRRGKSFKHTTSVENINGEHHWSRRWRWVWKYILNAKIERRGAREVADGISDFFWFRSAGFMISGDKSSVRFVHRGLCIVWHQSNQPISQLRNFNVRVHTDATSVIHITVVACSSNRLPYRDIVYTDTISDGSSFGTKTKFQTTYVRKSEKPINC